MTADKELLKRVFGIFKTGLFHSKPAKEYLDKIGIEQENLDCGYNSAQFHHREGLSEEETETSLEIGLLSPYYRKTPHGKDTTYSTFGGYSIIFPILNDNNEIVSFFAKNIKNGKGAILNKQGIFPKYPAHDIQHLLITENILDAASIYQDNNIKDKYGILALNAIEQLPDDFLKAIAPLNQLKEITFIIKPSKAKNDFILKHIDKIKTVCYDASFTIAEIPTNDTLNGFLLAHDKIAFYDLINNRKQFEDETFFDTSNPKHIQFKYKNIELTAIGGIKGMELDRLRITLKIKIYDHTHRENTNLFDTKAVETLANTIGTKTKTDIKLVLKAINLFTDKLERYFLNQQEYQNNDQTPTMTAEEKKELINFLKAPDLMDKTAELMESAGIIGNKKQLQLLFLAFTSRKNKPVSVICTDKSNHDLPSQVATLFDSSDVLEISRLTENSLYYMDKAQLNNKILLIDDLNTIEKAGIPLKEMILKQKISKITPQKDKMGNLKTKILEIETYSVLCIKTQKEKIKPEVGNITMTVHLDNSKELQQKLLWYQRQKASGKINALKEHSLRAFFKNIQHILKPVHIINPFAEKAMMPNGVLQPVLTNQLYLDFIEAVTFYHQFQREIKTDNETGLTYIEVSPEDIELANELIKENIIDKSNILSKPVRLFYQRLLKHNETNEDNIFTLKAINEYFNLPLSTLKRYIGDLRNHGFVDIVGGNRYKTGYEYQITGKNGMEQNTSIDQHFENIMNDIKKAS